MAAASRLTIRVHDLVHNMHDNDKFQHDEGRLEQEFITEVQIMYELLC
jgi:hypothetical protein